MLKLAAPLRRSDQTKSTPASQAHPRTSNTLMKQLPRLQPSSSLRRRADRTDLAPASEMPPQTAMTSEKHVTLSKSNSSLARSRRVNATSTLQTSTLNAPTSAKNVTLS